MSEREWFDLPSEPFFNNRQNNRISAWVPGDGLICSAGNTGRRSAVRCSAPAALHEAWGTRYDSSGSVTRRVVCSIHLAGLIRSLTRAERSDVTIKTLAQQAAREAVIAAHWAEYQDAIDEALKSEQESAFSKLPDWLREQIEAVA